MTKKMLRSAMIGFCVFTATIIIAYFTITAAYNTSARRAAEALAPTEQTASAEESVPLTSSDITPAEYYLAKYDNGSLNVYACSADSEEFLYTLDVRIEDISKEELSRLSEGIRLEDKQALASFEEDFSS